MVEIQHNIYATIREIYRRLKSSTDVDLNEYIAPSILTKGASPFELLIAVILSQNTSDANALKAFEKMKKVLGDITLQAILAASEETLTDVLKPAGMNRIRARRLKELSSAILNLGGESWLNALMNLDAESLRAELMKLPGVGPKTADVLTLMYYRKPSFPIDTHILRVVRRLGIFNSRPNYESIRRYFVEALGSNVADLIEFHLLLIAHGRRICKARKPLCNACILSDLCRKNL